MRRPAVGIFDEINREVPLRRMLAKIKLCYANGADLVYFCYDDIDFENDTVNARVWTPDGFKRERVMLPCWIECDGSYKCRDYFREKARVADDFKFSKKDLYDFLINTEFADMVIPSMYTANPQNVLGFLAMWSEIIVKPFVGSQGMSVISLKRAEGGYILHDADKGARSLTKTEAVSFLEEMYEKCTVIVQPRMNFVNKDGNTMDFRINVAKNGRGEWETMFIVPRTSRGNIISNLSHGGYASKPEPTIEIDYKENADKVLGILEHIGRTLPPLLESAEDDNVMALGIDVGFDYSTLSPYIIEVNNVPQVTSRGQLKYYMTQADYLTYLSKEVHKGNY